MYLSNGVEVDNIEYMCTAEGSAKKYKGWLLGLDYRFIYTYSAHIFLIVGGHNNRHARVHTRFTNLCPHAPTCAHKQKFD